MLGFERMFHFFLSFNKERRAKRSGQNVHSKMYLSRLVHSERVACAFFFPSRLLRACDSSGLPDMDHKSAAKHSMCEEEKKERNSGDLHKAGSLMSNCEGLISLRDEHVTHYQQRRERYTT